MTTQEIDGKLILLMKKEMVRCNLIDVEKINQYILKKSRKLQNPAASAATKLHSFTISHRV